VNADGVLSDGLLVLGLAIVLMSCLGVAVMPTAYDKLHFTGPAATLGVLAVGGSIVVRDGLGQAGIKTILCVVILALASPVVAHATARAIHVRNRDHLDPSTVDEPEP
jgi:multicomponent Na+:H+ antiporter subunit G